MPRRKSRANKKPDRQPPGAPPAEPPSTAVAPAERSLFATYMPWQGVGAVVIMLLAHAMRFIHYVNDDAYFTFRYSRFLALGRGPIFNLDEHV